MQLSPVLTLAVAAVAGTPALAQELATLKGHTGFVWSVAFSPDGKVLASAGSDGSVNLWDVHSRKKLTAFRPFPNTPGGIPYFAVHAVAFSPDGKTLALGGGAAPENSNNGQLKLWNVATQREDAVLKGHGSLVDCLSFSPDGKILASGDADGTVRLWDMARGDPRAARPGAGRQAADDRISKKDTWSLTAATDTWEGRPFVKVYLVSPRDVSRELVDRCEPPFLLEQMCSFRVDGKEAYVRSRGDVTGAGFKKHRKTVEGKTLLGILAFDGPTANHFDTYTPLVERLVSGKDGQPTRAPLTPGKHTLTIQLRSSWVQQIGARLAPADIKVGIPGDARGGRSEK